MKTKILFLFFLISSTFSFGQDKKELFYNTDLKEISKETFLSLKNNTNYNMSYESETAIKTYLVEREISGNLNYYLLETFKKYLLELNPKANFENSNYIVINYIDNDPSNTMKRYQVPWDVFENDISKQFKKEDKINHYYIINPEVKNLFYYHGNKLNWKTDNNHFLQQKFFNFKGLNGGFLIIDKNGNYYKMTGEYSKKDVLAKLEELKNKKND